MGIGLGKVPWIHAVFLLERLHHRLFVHDEGIGAIEMQLNAVDTVFKGLAKEIQPVVADFGIGQAETGKDAALLIFLGQMRSLPIVLCPGNRGAVAPARY